MNGAHDNAAFDEAGNGGTPATQPRRLSGSIGKRPRSVATHIAVATSGLAILIILLVGVVSYHFVRQQISQGMRNALKFEAALLADRVAADFRGVTRTLRTLAESSMLINALADSVVADTQLAPFLRDLTVVSDIPVVATVTNFAGERIAGDDALTFDSPDRRRRVLEDGEAQTWIVSEDGAPVLVSALPITYYRTTSPEGALLYRVFLRDLLSNEWLVQRPKEGQALPIRHVRLAFYPPEQQPVYVIQHLDADGAEPAAWGEGAIERVSLAVIDGGLPLRIEVDVAADESQLPQPIQTLVVVIIGVATLAIAVAIIVGWSAGRRIARPILRLERVVSAILASGSLAHRSELRGPREIVRLGQAFDDMLDRLAQAYEQLRQLAQIDSLTGLPNRRLFHERLHSALAQSQRTGRPTALFLLDLDNFKIVNDQLGHPVGDALLRATARRLREQIRDTDTVARLGGDEFAVIASNLREGNDADVLARKLIQAFARMFDVEGHMLAVTASVGVSVSIASEMAKPPVEMLRDADLALYRVKAEGGNGYRHFSPEMNVAAINRMSMETTIRDGLVAGRFQLYLQPKIDVLSGDVLGAEALLRHDHGRSGFCIQDMIAVAEKSGQINSVGAWVLDAACGQARMLRARGLPPITIAINVSAVQLYRPEFAQAVLSALQERDLPASALELEITESAVMERSEAVATTLRQLASAGLRIAVDDFGTGYASLTYLKRFPIDTVKIDGSFIDGLGRRADDAAITRAIVALGQSLNLTVIAEGVQTHSQASFLLAHGCHIAQGYLYCAPLPLDDFAIWWQQRLSATAAARLAGERRHG